ncbi:enhanced intracellular survival protein Eis [Agrilactobacillus fermenti]|uniref:GNAT family N-acetyltransferase n=1 Tax=Agrilactobacillus fermenti TaxID=2586909 RepID=UPI003A5BE860
MAVSYRLGLEDEANFYQLYLYAFNRQDSDARRAFFKTRYAHAQAYGIYDDKQQLVSGLYQLPFKVNFFGKTMSMGGIGDVMTAPEASGQGLASLLLKQTLVAMHQQKTALSYLAPFSFRYYAKFGYTYAFDKVCYQVPATLLKNYAKPLADEQIYRSKLKAVNMDTLALITKKFPQAAGGIIREQWWWDYLLKKNDWELVCLYQQDRIMGYALYERQAAQFVVEEMATVDQQSRDRLFNFFAAHSNNFETIRFYKAGSQVDLDLFSEPSQVKTQILPYMMARIVNLSEFFKAYPYQGRLSQPVTLAISDTIIAENQGLWRLAMQDGQLDLVKQADTLDQADIQISIAALTAACLGVASLSDLMQRGQVVGTPEQIQILDELLIHQRGAISDYF